MGEQTTVAGGNEMGGRMGGASWAVPFGRGSSPAAKRAPGALPPHPWPHGSAWAATRWAQDPMAARGVAHDLNNLLALILGHAEMALDCAAAGSAVHTSLEQITHAADLGATLTGRWLGTCRGHDCSPRPTGINAVVCNALDIFRPLLPPDVGVQIELQPCLWWAPAIAVAIEELVINLVDNAREAMLAGGTLTVRTENVVVGEEGWPDARLTGTRVAGIRPARPGRWVCLTVADTGVGMDRATLERIFEPYFTAKREGTGLGLAMVQRILREHDGWAAVTSESGRGTTLRVFLPACAPPVEAAPSAPSGDPVAQGSFFA
ncbi:MAG TPA: ATP-binding protein [Planctomycetota bacterium]|nr:ATP-binding protein [Planctomycetota bacterium]